MKGKHLITTEEYFVAPDGQQYKAVFGTVTIVDKRIMIGELKANPRSVNWYAQVGTGQGSIIIAGCQISYAVKCDILNYGKVTSHTMEDGKKKSSVRETLIYIPQSEYQELEKQNI